MGVGDPVRMVGPVLDRCQPVALTLPGIGSPGPLPVTFADALALSRCLIEWHRLAS